MIDLNILKHKVSLVGSTLLFTFLTASPFWASAQSNVEYRNIADQVLMRMQATDILVFGEDHENSLSRELLMKILEKGFATGQIDSFTTEYVLEEVEADFQNYLTSATAVPDSEEEKKLFDRITQEFRYVWLKDPINKQFFRFLREQKIKYGDKIAICGNDILPSKWRPNGDGSTNQDELNKVLRTQRFEKMPPVLLDAAVKKFARSKTELIEALTTNYDREPLMALRSAKCIHNKKKSVIHMGGSHAWGIQYFPYREADEIVWEATSHFLPVLMPQKKIETINMMTGDQNKPESVEAMKKVMTDLSNSSDQFLMVSREQLNTFLKSKSPDYPENGPLSMWDFLIFTSNANKTPLWAK